MNKRKAERILQEQEAQREADRVAGLSAELNRLEDNHRGLVETRGNIENRISDVQRLILQLQSEMQHLAGEIPKIDRYISINETKQQQVIDEFSRVNDSIESEPDSGRNGRRLGRAALNGTEIIDLNEAIVETQVQRPAIVVRGAGALSEKSRVVVGKKALSNILANKGGK